MATEVSGWIVEDGKKRPVQCVLDDDQEQRHTDDWKACCETGKTMSGIYEGLVDGEMKTVEVDLWPEKVV